MPYRPRDIYRGRRKFRVPLTIFLTVLGLLLAGGIVLFYALQQYLVYGQDGVTLQLPFMQAEEGDQAGAGDAAVSSFEPVEVEVVYEDPDFSDVDLGGWQNLAPTRALFVAYADAADAEKLSAAVTGVSPDDYTGLVLELKDESGQLAWASQNEMAVSYGTSGLLDYTETAAALHEKGMTAAAQISCCADMCMATRNWPLALQSYDGAPYEDEDGVYWLDPYNRTVRSYLAELMGELAAMGFDEIILADLYHPVSETGFTYSVSIQTTPDPVAAVCQMGRQLVESLSGTDVAVSALIDKESMTGGLASRTGQDLAVFWRLFARLYCPSDASAAVSDTELAAADMTQGDASVRLALVCPYAPEGVSSYVIAAPET